MSRIGKKPIEIPAGVEVKIDDNNVVVVKGAKGTLTTAVSTEMKLVMEGNTILVERPSDAKLHRSLHGLTRTLIANMVEGVSTGFKKELSTLCIKHFSPGKCTPTSVE